METVDLYTNIKDAENHTPFKSSRQTSGVACRSLDLTPCSGTGRNLGLCDKPHLQNNNKKKFMHVTGETHFTPFTLEPHIRLILPVHLSLLMSKIHSNVIIHPCFIKEAV